MGDFLLDMRPAAERAGGIEPLVFFADMQVDAWVLDELSFFSTRVGPAALWSPFVAPDRVHVAVCGNLVLDAAAWRRAEAMPGEGGLAAKALYLAYESHGIEGVGPLNGNAVVLIHDPREHATHLLVDQCGVSPCFVWEGGPVASSHPDFLAQATGCASRWDTTSLAELLTTGRVSPPRSYYSAIRAVRHNSVHTWTAGAPGGERRFPDSPDEPSFDGSREEQLSEELTAAIRRSVERRTDERFGRAAVALSGGLDSRIILCSAPRERLIALSAFDRENAEYRIARRIARSQGVELIALPRDFEHYGSAAELAVRISGGMGDIGSAHFLGFRSRLRELGVENLITGCYFDYLFKSLALDVSTTRWLRRERLGPFQQQSYLPHFVFDTPLARRVRERLEADVRELHSDSSSEGRYRIAAMRTFPLSAEGDNMQRVVTQKMIGWHAPAVDSEVMSVYRRVRPEMRLNRRLFKRVVRRSCGAAVALIPDANTGLPVTAPTWLEGINRYRIALRRQWERWRPSIVSQESWPNWVHYLNESPVVHSLWSRPNAAAADLFREITGAPVPARLRVRSDEDCRLALRMLTLKIWLDQREP